MSQFLAMHPEMGITVHDFLLQELFEVGIAGLVVWLVIWWFLWWTPHRQYRRALANGNRTAAMHWWCCRLAVVCFLLANLPSPLPLSRSDWLIPFLAVGTWRYWPARALQIAGAARPFPAQAAPGRVGPQWGTAMGAGAWPPGRPNVRL